MLIALAIILNYTVFCEIRTLFFFRSLVSQLSFNIMLVVCTYYIIAGLPTPYVTVQWCYSTQETLTSKSTTHLKNRSVAYLHWPYSGQRFSLPVPDWQADKENTLFHNANIHPLWIVLFFSYFDTFSTILNRILHLQVYRAFFVKNSTFLHLFLWIFLCW